MKELLINRADVNAADNQGATALHVAAQSGFIPIMQVCACVYVWKCRVKALRGWELFCLYCSLYNGIGFGASNIIILLILI